MVSFSFTPFSSMSTVCLVISTVWLIRSVGQKHTADLQPSVGPEGVWVCLLAHLLRWAAFCLCADRWGTGCLPVWIYPNQILLKHQGSTNKLTNLCLTKRFHLDQVKAKHPNCPPLVVRCRFTLAISHCLTVRGWNLGSMKANGELKKGRTSTASYLPPWGWSQILFSLTSCELGWAELRSQRNLSPAKKQKTWLVIWAFQGLFFF